MWKKLEKYRGQMMISLAVLIFAGLSAYNWLIAPIPEGTQMSILRMTLSGFMNLGCFILGFWGMFVMFFLSDGGRK